MSVKSNSNENLLSIVIPCKNEVTYIGRLLDSILKQNYDSSKIPIFIADAGSTDGTLEVIAEYKYKLNIQVIPGGLPAKARNNGAKMCKSEYILFIDADAEFRDPNLILKALMHMNNSDLHCLAASIRSVSQNLVDQISMHLLTLSQFHHLIGKPFGVGIFLLFRRDMFWRLGGFSEELVIDEDRNLTKKIDRTKFGVMNGQVLTSNRRVAKMGYLNFIRFSFKVFLNQNKPEFFREHHGYWD
ncbi:MAG: hypothetical protein OHK0017_12640 [Patescibacteria group bacterium]